MPPEKKEIFEHVNSLLESAKFSEAAEQMKPWTKALIIQFVQSYPENHRILELKDFNDFWADKRAKLCGKFAFVEQPNLPDMDFVCGYIFYLLAQIEKKKSNSEEYEKYLAEALTYNSIHAAQTLLHDCIMQNPQDKTKHMELIASILNNWNGLATKHTTPGYLLLANGYLHLIKMGAELQNSDLFDNAGSLLWQNLTLAELYEPHSEASISNAYFGQGLKQSNPEHISTIQEIKEACAKFIKDDDIKSHAEHKAHLIFNRSDDNKLGMWKAAKSGNKWDNMENSQSPRP